MIAIDYCFINPTTGEGEEYRFYPPEDKVWDTLQEILHQKYGVSTSMVKTLIEDVGFNYLVDKFETDICHDLTLECQEKALEEYIDEFENK